MTLHKIGVGMMLAFALFLIGVILNAFIPKVHSYAFMIIIVFVLKALDIVPKPLEEAVVMFNRVIMTNLTHAVLAGIGLSMIDLSSLAQAMTWQFVLISLTSVVSMGLASSILRTSSRYVSSRTDSNGKSSATIVKTPRIPYI